MLRSTFRLSAFHHSSCLVSHASLLAFVLGLCLFPFALPCFAPAAALTGDHLLLSLSVLFPSSDFLSSICFRFLLLRFPFLTFPFIPASPNGGSSGAKFIRLPFACFHAPFRFWYSACCIFLSPSLTFATQRLLQAPHLSFRVGSLSLAFALGLGYLAFRDVP